MRKRIIGSMVAIALIFGLIGFVVGLRAMENVEDRLVEIFSEDVVEVRQGKLAGAFIAMAEDEALSEQWEELCSDILRDLGRR